ncbi:histidine phosphatase family protein [Lysobacter pythonis]|uniref:Histidine phosphatase family protein n=1 Tax=Solilutibacter pythonis TaxID=2483112 RepID=A0A3M2HXM9_9GAMM|nr:histidine phosphatase family protein [Lysobacter pythonis]RMH90937.1 histidine phosphatase family protein [Lysobacter pythonis]
MTDIPTELVLLRHAHALPMTDRQTDIERALSPTGQAEARAAGLWLRQHLTMPDAVLCSPARRTRETLQGVLDAGCRLPDAKFEPRIYEASPGTLLAVLADAMAHPSAPVRIWLIGHNPGLERLLAHLDADAAPARPSRGMPTAGIAVLRSAHGRAPDETGGVRLAAFHAP